MEKSNHIKITLLVVSVFCLAGSAIAAPPKVVKTIPGNGERNVDPKLRQIRIEFDQKMDTQGYSVCGGGPLYPKTIGKGKWVNSRAFVMRVRLQPNHEYKLSVNCPSYENFKNLRGEPAGVYPIEFRTAAAGQGKSKPARVLLQEGIYAEEVQGDLDAAMRIYEQVIDQAEETSRAAAQATYRLGMCYLKKGEKEKAAEYFQQIISNYSTQKILVKKADEQLKKVKPETKKSVFEQIDGQVIKFISEKYGKTAGEAGQKNLYANSHIYYVDPNFTLYNGGMGFYYNWTGQTITSKTKLTGTSYPNQTLYDTTGEKLNTEIVQDEQRSNFYHIFWIPKEPLAPGESLYYGWSIDDSRRLSSKTGQTATLTMQNQFGSPVIETFFLVLPKELQISQGNPPTGNEELLNFNVYWWTKTVQQGENHVEVVQLGMSDIGTLVRKSVMTISTCAEGDARIDAAMATIKSLGESDVLSELKKYLNSEEDTIRRSAIYIIWQGRFSNISDIVPELEKLCSHNEDLTRGMAGLALGQNKVLSSFTVLKKMTLDDPSGYARRCGAYALGLLGDVKAKPILEKALNDPDKLVQKNAGAALRMLELKSSDAGPVANPSTDNKKKAEDLTAQGWKLWRQRKLAEAEEAFKQATEKDPTNDNAYQGLGWAQMNQGRKLNAKAAFEKCIQINPQNAAALNGLGWIARGQGDADEAIGWWEKAIAAQPGATASLSGLTQVYMERKEYDKAIKYYRMWLKAEPNNKQAKEGLEKAKALNKN